MLEIDPAIDTDYRLILWLIPKLMRFPRLWKFLLATGYHADIYAINRDRDLLLDFTEAQGNRKQMLNFGTNIYRIAADHAEYCKNRSLNFSCRWKKPLSSRPLPKSRILLINLKLVKTQ